MYIFNNDNLSDFKIAMLPLRAKNTKKKKTKNEALKNVFS